MVVFKTVRFRLTRDELNVALCDIEDFIRRNPKFRKAKDLHDEWQVTITRMDHR